MAKPQLTDRQKKVYELIRSLIQERGYGPTVREIGEHFGIKSPNGVMCHLRALERKGLISRKANKSRAIELTGENARSATGLPLMGVVSDHPSELDTNPTDAIDLGKTLATGERFVVQVSGNSFSEYGVLDGDFLIIEQEGECTENSLVVVKLTDGRVSMRKWCPEMGSPGATEGGDAPGVMSVLGVAVSMVREKMALV
ncbi:transcriptional repressor LexA [Rhodopirellula sallentina]|uniref:SOS-response transcriptional repressor, LexA n=1 Tax=Rhodopirellula sallentina SM41 TaxID=1263870 RepID=M5U2S6_9BACT|nr:transcriptional repressor LexA [Rhodopirellula sallentina]EMI55757.1 SOS-response transcriptional repressor, LexA [Rhodopirellula sallentina SM41]